MEDQIVLNIDFDIGITHLNGSTSIQIVPANIAWEDFSVMLKVFSDEENIKVFYLDDDNDYVIISCEEELQEAFKVANKSKNTLSLKIRSSSEKTKQGSETSDQEVKQIHTDLNRQSVSMKMVKEPVPVSNDEVPIAMETGEQTKLATDPSCDRVVTPETGEKLEVTPKINAEVAHNRKALDMNGALILEKDTVKTAPKTLSKTEKRFFFIKHDCGLVLDVQAWKTQEGTPVILYPKKDIHKERIGNQLWFEDKSTRTIRPKFCQKMCLTAVEGELKIMPYAKDAPFQRWKLQDRALFHPCTPGLVLIPRALRASSRVHVKVPGEHELSKCWTYNPFFDMKKHKANTNKETGEDQAGAIPKKGKRGEAYTRLAAAMRSKQPSLADCVPWPLRQNPPPQAEGRHQAPRWFMEYMDKFKTELVENTSSSIAERTVSRVLRGLEGAVITSVKEVSHHVSGAKADPEFVAQSPESPGVYCHNGIICDNCEKTIIGVRYKCGNCEDYDLCSHCEDVAGVHDSEHIFLKIRRPLFTAGRRADGKLVALLPKNLYRYEQHMVQKSQNQQQDWFPQPTEQAPVLVRHLTKERLDKLKRKQEKLKQKHEKIKVKEEKLKRRIQEEKALPPKKEKLETPQCNVPQSMDAMFVSHDSIPDDTHVQPGTKFTKRWILRNTGTIPWTSGTILNLIYGNILPAEESEVAVPYVAPGEEGLVSVCLVAPCEPGVYQSHWRLSYCGVRFGNRIWCSIIVDPKEVLDPRETPSDLDLKMVTSGETQKESQDVDEKETESVTKEFTSEAQENEDETAPLLTATCVTANQQAAFSIEKQESSTNQEAGDHVADEDDELPSKDDLLSFELMEINETVKPPSSHTATPNNTPLESRDVTPPRTPRTPRSLTRTSSVEVVPEASVDGQDGSDITAELVQQRMANLGLSSSYKAEMDIESLSSSEEWSSDESDCDFFIVPIPDFFNPELPASRSSSTSLVVTKDKRRDSQMTDEASVTTENQDETEPLLPPHDGIEFVPLETIEHEEEYFEVANDVPEHDGNISDDDNEGEDAPAAASSPVTSEVPVSEPEVKEINAPAQNDEEEEQGAAAAEQTERQAVHVVDPLSDAAALASPTEVASQIVNNAFGFATKATTHMYHTAKDVFHTMQARKEYMPPRSEWTPREQAWAPQNINWSPPRQQWVPPQQDGTPVEAREQWTPPENDAPAPEQEQSQNPMRLLMEMGFADRNLNQRLLDENENNVEKVIQLLLRQTDNDWHANRH